MTLEVYVDEVRFLVIILDTIVLQRYTGQSLMSSLANSDDPDEKLHNAAVHQSLHSLL